MFEGGTSVTRAKTKSNFAKYFSEESRPLTFDVKVL
jgi:hypothetical protein